jgi:hypothetical protein
LKNRNDTTFLVDVYSPKYPLNFTTTRAPIFDNTTNIITLNFDGTFYDVDLKTNHVDDNQIFANRVEDKNLGNSQQIFIHETMLSSAFFAAGKEFMPIKVNDTNATT